MEKTINIEYENENINSFHYRLAALEQAVGYLTASISVTHEGIQENIAERLIANAAIPENTSHAKALTQLASIITSFKVVSRS